MKYKRFIMQLALLLVTLAYLSGCSQSEASPTPVPATDAPPTPTSEEPAETEATAAILEVTFDGSECVYSGPGDVPQGKVNLRFVNQGEAEYWLGVIELEEGQTWDDFLTTYSPPGSEQGGPDTWGPGGGYVITGPKGETAEHSPFLMAGEYGLVCVIPGAKNRIWVGAPLTVDG